MAAPAAKRQKNDRPCVQQLEADGSLLKYDLLQAWAVMDKWIGSVSEVPDVTIQFVSNEASRLPGLGPFETNSHYDKRGSEVTLHSKVLSSYSEYFRTCLSERWKGESRSVSRMPLELHADVRYYLDCFSRMYSLYAKNFDFGLKGFGDVRDSLELLKVASQIQFDDLIDSILLSLSTRFWSKEDEDRIREYSSSEDFPRSRAEDLVGRLGLNESEEVRDKKLYDMLQHIILTALDNKIHTHGKALRVSDVDVEGVSGVDVKVEAALSRSYQKFLENVIRHNASPNATPSNLGRTVIMMLTREGRNMLDGLDQDYYHYQHRPHLLDSCSRLKNRIEAICYVLKTLLAYKVADVELVKSFLHLDVMISKSCEYMLGISSLMEFFSKKLTEIVLLIFQDMVDGRLPFKTSERKAVLAKWQPFLIIQIDHGTDSTQLAKLKQVLSKLFSTLSFQDKTEIQKTLGMSGHYCFNDFISDDDLELMLSKRCCWPAACNLSSIDTSSYSGSASKD